MVAAIKARDEAEADRLAHNHTRVFGERIRDFMKVTYLVQPGPPSDAPGAAEAAG